MAPWDLRTFVCVLSIPLVLVSLACREREAAIEMPNITQWFAATVDPHELHPCGPVIDSKRTAVPVRLFIAADADQRAVKKYVSSLRKLALVWEFNVSLAISEATALDSGPVFRMTRTELNDALAKTGAADVDGEKKEAVTARILGQPMRTHLSSFSPPSTGWVNVVFLDRLVGSRSVMSSYLGDAAGLTLSPFMADSKKIAGLWDLPAHSPTVFLSLRELEQMDPKLALAVPFHEMGHALGLDHRPAPSNLMAEQRQPGCLPVLEAGQLTAMAANLSRMRGK